MWIKFHLLIAIWRQTSTCLSNLIICLFSLLNGVVDRTGQTKWKCFCLSLVWKSSRILILFRKNKWRLLRCKMTNKVIHCEWYLISSVSLKVLSLYTQCTKRSATFWRPQEDVDHHHIRLWPKVHCMCCELHKLPLTPGSLCIAPSPNKAHWV